MDTFTPHHSCVGGETVSSTVAVSRVYLGVIKMPSLQLPRSPAVQTSENKQESQRNLNFGSNSFFYANISVAILNLHEGIYFCV